MQTIFTAFLIDCNGKAFQLEIQANSLYKIKTAAKWKTTNVVEGDEKWKKKNKIITLKVGMFESIFILRTFM